MRRKQKIWIGLTAAAGLAYIVLSLTGGEDAEKEEAEVIYTVLKEGETTPLDDDIVQYSAEILKEDGTHLLGGVLSWGVVRNNVPPLRQLIKKVKVGGEGKLVAPYDKYFPGGGESFLPQGTTVYAAVKVVRHIPQRYAVETSEEQRSFVVIDIGGMNSIDTLGGEDWRIKKTSAKWLDSRNARLFSIDGGDAVLCDWLGPKSGLLVKRGEATGEVSGIELVGGSGDKNAFEDLRSFDLDGDGLIDGDELAQLWLWSDTNSNAKVDDGELVSANDVFLNIKTTPTEGEKGSLASPVDGATLKDGRTVGVWEWWTRRAEGGWSGPRMATPQNSRGVSGVGQPGASLFLFNVCGGDQPDLLGGDGGVNGTRFIGLSASTGSGQAEARRWHWVGACSGLLMVGDAAKSPQSQIGEHLIGGVTGGQTWGNSYEPLTYLDTNGDGVLEGEELDTLLVWVDRSTDGRVDSWEISRAGDTISKITLTPKRNAYGILSVSEDGVVFKDGTSSPSWCWEVLEEQQKK